jgi:hypothetical protein
MRVEGAFGGRARRELGTVRRVGEPEHGNDQHADHDGGHAEDCPHLGFKLGG